MGRNESEALVKLTLSICSLFHFHWEDLAVLQNVVDWPSTQATPCWPVIGLCINAPSW